MVRGGRGGGGCDGCCARRSRWRRGAGRSVGKSGNDSLTAMSPETTQTAYTGFAPAESGGDWKAALTSALANMDTSRGGGGGSHVPAVAGMSSGSYDTPQITMPKRTFALTPRQSQILRGLGNEDAQRAVMTRLQAGDPALGPYTAEQVAALRGGG